MLQHGTSRSSAADAAIVVDLGFGDAGKGSVVDFLVRQRAAHTVIRFNGGAQAGHRVVTADGREHVFSQFGAGTFAGADTFLSRFMLVDPPALFAEADALTRAGVIHPLARLAVDGRALVVTPFQRAVNRLRELSRGARRHGSCGMGIGETMADALALGDAAVRVGDLRDAPLLEAKLEHIRLHNQAKAASLTLPAFDSTLGEAVLTEWNVLHDPVWLEIAREDGVAFADRVQIVDSGYLDRLLQRPGTIVFEGAQGVLLDEWAGFHPHTTWSTTTPANAMTLLQEAQFSGRVERLGVTRAYMTRHGAGPLPTEDSRLTAALPDACNDWGAWQAGFRTGWLDLVLLRYALDVAGPLDGVAITCLDRVATLPELQLCRAYATDLGLLSRIQPAAHGRSLAHQAELTELLSQAQPLLHRVPDLATLVESVCAELGLPLRLASWGPTARDKQWGRSLMGGDLRPPASAASREGVGGDGTATARPAAIGGEQPAHRSIGRKSIARTGPVAAVAS